MTETAVILIDKFPFNSFPNNNTFFWYKFQKIVRNANLVYLYVLGITDSIFTVTMTKNAATLPALMDYLIAYIFDGVTTMKMTKQFGESSC